MSELGDILGEEFEEEYEEKRQSRRQEASKVETPVMMEICYEAINNGGFKGEEPRFRFSSNTVDHDVLLMESPEDDLDTFRWPLGDTAKSQGMFHVDQLFSLAFQENMLDLLNKIETDEYYLVVGKYEETTQSNGSGEEETYYNINPVRGIVPLSVAKKYADKFEEKMGGSSIEEQSEEQNSSSSDDSSSDVDMGGLDDGVSDKDIVEVFQGVGNKAPNVLEAVSEGDSDMMDKLVNVTNNNLDGDTDREHILDVFEDNVESIDGRGEDSDDGLDLGGIDSDDDGSTDQSSDKEQEDPTDGGESEDPSDWF